MIYHEQIYLWKQFDRKQQTLRHRKIMKAHRFWSCEHTLGSFATKAVQRHKYQGVPNNRLDAVNDVMQR